MSIKPTKPLGTKAYGSIPHLPGSRRGTGDIGLSDEQARILTHKARDKHDHITVQEKLDGSCVSVAKINGEIIPLMRAGYRARDSEYPQHHHFHDWVMIHVKRFDSLLREGQRCCGEWLMEAHGTLYQLRHEPLVLFDLMDGQRRETVDEYERLFGTHGFTMPHKLHQGPPISIEDILTKLDSAHHGTMDEIEGAVWRVERHGEVDFLGKFVRHGKTDGKYLTVITGLPAVYNWSPPVPNSAT